jgi:hypothetical protein
MNISINPSPTQALNVRKAIASVNPEPVNNSAISTGANRDSGPSLFNSNLGFSLFGQSTLNNNNSFGTDYVRADGLGSQYFVTSSMKGNDAQRLVSTTANSFWENAAREASKAALSRESDNLNRASRIESQNIREDIDIKENFFDKINPLEYFGHNGSEISKFDFKRAGRFDIPPTKIKEDSKLLKLMPSKGMAEQLWNGIRENVVTGNDNKGLFSDDDHLNKALNNIIKKFESGLNGEQHEFQNAVRNKDTLSYATAYNLSADAIHGGAGKLLDKYARIDNVGPENIINRDYLQTFYNNLSKNDGNVIDALASAKHKDNKTYGKLDVTSDEVKSFANHINREGFKALAESLDLNHATLEKTLIDKGGIYGENSMYNISPAMALATAKDFSLLDKNREGYDGFEELVNKSNQREGFVNKESHVNFHIRPQGDQNTDGTAFVDVKQNGLEALSSLSKHIGGGLSNDSTKANSFSFVFKDENHFKEYAPKILEQMKKAGLDVTKLEFDVEGHGSKENGAMIKSGIIGQDHQSIDKKDSEFFASLLKHVNKDKLTQVEVNYDSCFGRYSAEHNAETINARARELGMNIAVRSEGSRQEGLVLSESGGENNQQDRFAMNADGSVSATSQRKDDGGTDLAKVFYSKDENAFQDRMKEIRDARANSSETQNDLVQKEEDPKAQESLVG